MNKLQSYCSEELDDVSMMMGPKMAVIQVAKIEGTKLLYVKWQLAFNISYFMWVGGFY